MGTLLPLVTGAAVGATMRYYVSLWAAVRWPAFPYGTLAVNLVGSLLIGFFVVLIQRHPGMGAATRLFLVTGLCGSLTTFSTFSYETVALIENGLPLAALLNVLLNTGLGVGCVLLGLVLAQRLV